MTWLTTKFGALACFAGYHAGYFAYVRGDACDQQRICPRPGCGAVEAAVTHQWAEPPPGSRRYLAEGTCEVAAICGRCWQGGGPVIVLHEWGPWERIPGSDWVEADGLRGMEIIRLCQHCGAHQRADSAELLPAA